MQSEPTPADLRACRRIEEAAKQPDLFIEPPAKPVQEGLGL